MKHSVHNIDVSKKCQRRSDARRLKKLRKSSEQTVINSIDKNLANLHPFHILSDSEYNKIRRNNIMLDNLKVFKDHTRKARILTVYQIQMENIGENLQKHLKRLSRNNVIDISRVKRRFMTMTMHINDYNKTQNTIKFLGVEPPNSSGVILLSIATYNNAFEKCQNMDRKMKIFRSNRYNIGSNRKPHYHNCTVGESYGVGLVAKYNKDENDLSFGTYAERKKLQPKNKSSILFDIMDELISLSLQKPLEIIPDLQTNVMIVGQSLKNHLKYLSETKLQTCKLGEIRSYMSCQFNINSVTHIPHTELDHSSTIIYVPQQTVFNQKYYFEFVLNHFTSIQICLKPGTTIIYTPLLLVHRQISSHMPQLTSAEQAKSHPSMYNTYPECTRNHLSNVKVQKSNFINISTYFNKRLHDNIGKSLSRVYSNIQKDSPSFSLSAGGTTVTK